MKNEFDELWEAANNGDEMAIGTINELLEYGALMKDGYSEMNEDDTMFLISEFFNSSVVEPVLEYLENQAHVKNDVDFSTVCQLVERLGLEAGLYLRLSSNIRELDFAKECLTYSKLAREYVCDNSDGEYSFVDVEEAIDEITERIHMIGQI